MRHPKTTALVALAAALVCVDLFAATIVFKEKAQIDGPRVSLSDVAEVTDTDEDTAGSLGKIDLGSAPWPGSVRRVDGLVVKLKLYQNGVDPNDISIERDSYCTLTTGGLEVSADRIVRIAREHLMRSCRWPKDDLEVELASKPHTRLIPAGCGEDAIRPASHQTFRRLGRVLVGVDILVEGTPRFRETVAFNVRLFENVVVAARDLERKEILTRDNVQTRRTELKRWPSEKLTRINRVIGAAAKRPLAEGTPLVDSMIIEPLMVERGDQVKLVYRTATMELTAVGVACENGKRGQAISVQNVTSQKRLVGRVIDPKTILIEG